MGRVNKLFLRLCAYSVTQGRLVYVPGPCAAALGLRADRESTPTVVAEGLRRRERTRRHEGMPPYVPA